MEPGLRCPYCKNIDCGKVIETIKVEDGIRRRNRCKVCNEIFPSFEYVGVKQIIVRKRSKGPELFKREKVKSGLELAFTKLGVDPTYIDALTDEVCNRIHGSGKREVSSEEIGRAVLEVLLNESCDEAKVAYVRFASVFLYVRRREDLIELVSHAQEKVCQPHNHDAIEVS